MLFGSVSGVPRVLRIMSLFVDLTFLSPPKVQMILLDLYLGLTTVPPLQRRPMKI